MQPLFSIQAIRQSFSLTNRPYWTTSSHLHAVITVSGCVRCHRYEEMHSKVIRRFERNYGRCYNSRIITLEFFLLSCMITFFQNPVPNQYPESNPPSVHRPVRSTCFTYPNSPQIGRFGQKRICPTLISSRTSSYSRILRCWNQDLM